MRWSYGNRFELYAACKLLIAEDITPNEAGMCLYALMESNEIYIDPTFGKNIYVFDNEIEMISDLGQKLHDIIGERYPIKLGSIAMDHENWADAIYIARKLLSRLQANGLAPQQVLDATP